MKPLTANILIYLLSKNECTIEKIAEIFSLNTRSIYYEIENINHILKKNKLSDLQKIQGKLSILPEEKSKIKKLFSSGNIFNAIERRLYLYLKLFSNTFISLSQEAKNLGVTRKTLSSDIKEIEQYLAEFNIKIESYPAKGVAIYGEETIIRILFTVKYYIFLLKPEICRGILKKIHEEYKEKYNFLSLERASFEIQKIFKIDSHSYFYHSFLAILFSSQIRISSKIGEKIYYNEKFYKNIKKFASKDPIYNKYLKRKNFVLLKNDEKIARILDEILEKYHLEVDDLTKYCLIDIILKGTNDETIRRKSVYYEEAIKFSEKFKKYEDSNIWDDTLLKEISFRHQLSFFKSKYNFLINSSFFRIKITPEMNSIFKIVKKICKELWGWVDLEEFWHITYILYQKLLKHKEQITPSLRVIIGDFYLGNSFLEEFYKKIKTTINIEVIEIIPAHIMKYALENNKNIDCILIFEPDISQTLAEIKIPIVLLNPYSVIESTEILKNIYQKKLSL
jgi:transcriptional antiterminator